MTGSLTLCWLGIVSLGLSAAWGVVWIRCRSTTTPYGWPCSEEAARPLIFLVLGLLALAGAVL